MEYSSEVWKLRPDELDSWLRLQVPLEGYDLTFLFTAAHLERYRREALADFVLQVCGAPAPAPTEACSCGWGACSAWPLHMS